MLKMRTDNMDSFVEWGSELHFSIVPTSIPANKERVDAVRIKPETHLPDTMRHDATLRHPTNRSYDTGHSFEPILMKFTCLVPVHS